MEAKKKKKHIKHFKVVVSPMYSRNHTRRKSEDQDTEPDPRHSSF